MRGWLQLSEGFVVRENGRLAVTVLKCQHEDWNVLGLDSTDADERLYCGRRSLLPQECLTYIATRRRLDESRHPRKSNQQPLF